MKSISPGGWKYLAYSLTFCGYFSAATIGGWPAPDFPAGGGTYSGGSSYSGRSSGGSWGGGK